LPKPWVIISESATETARFLISQAGGVQAAHDAVSRAASAQPKKEPGGAIVDTHWLRLAAKLQTKGISDSAALRAVADRCFKEHAEVEKQSMIRRLRRKLNGRTIAEAVLGS
jgi:hypothetical protein